MSMFRHGGPKKFKSRGASEIGMSADGGRIGARSRESLAGATRLPGGSRVCSRHLMNFNIDKITAGR